MSYHYNYNRTLISNAKSGRRDQTDAEKLFWFKVRNRQLLGYKFRRQYTINNYILDFYCVEKKLAIELDGSQHVKRSLYDDRRTQSLEKLGIKVLRFWDNEVLQNIDGVLESVSISLGGTSIK